MKATELMANQMGLLHSRIGGLAELTEREWLARPRGGGNRIGFTAWHMVATRDWAIRPLLQNRRPVGWDAPFLGTGIARCEIPFGMSAAEADLIAESVTPVELVAYSAAVTTELVRWLATVEDSALSAPPNDGRAHLSLSPRYSERGYLWEFEEDPDDMSLWPVWSLLTRPAFVHCLGHLTEIEFARQVA